MSSQYDKLMIQRVIHPFCLMLGITALFISAACKQPDTIKAMNTEKKNIGSLSALYPKHLTVIGAEVDEKVNWLVGEHTGITGHDRIFVSMNKKHHTNPSIRQSRKLSINLVSREMLPETDYVGNVSGAITDKSQFLKYHCGANGTPVIDASPLTMECSVEKICEADDSDNLICSVANTYASPESLDISGQLDYKRLKPVVFGSTTYSYTATGEVTGKCLNQNKMSGMCAKEPMSGDGIVRLSKIEVYPEYLDEYMRYAVKVGEVSLRTEPGVLTMYALSEKEHPCRITILETYANRAAYDRHITSNHFQHYKQKTLHMIRSLVLSDQTPLNPKNKINNFIQ